MSMLVDVFAHQPPETLFHYTTQAGLLGILRKREVWATHTQYLNDGREYLHAIDLATERLAQLMYPTDGSPGPQPSAMAALEAMSNGLIGVEGECVCVFSLSEDGDSLSQWRAYGGTTSGFCIGFSRATLDAVCDRNKVRLGKCIYNPDDQRQLINEIIRAVLEYAAAMREPGIVDWQGAVAVKMGDLMNQYAPLIKHPKFAAECEWRLISGSIAAFAQGFDFREGRSTVVPFYRITLDKSDDDQFSPAEVMVGPTPHVDQAVHAVRLLLVRCGMPMAAIDHVSASQVPYRSW